MPDRAPDDETIERWIMQAKAAMNAPDAPIAFLDANDHELVARHFRNVQPEDMIPLLTELLALRFIVRELAAHATFRRVHESVGMECPICGSVWPPYATREWFDHDMDCPYRLAREWAIQHEEVTS